MLNPEEKQLPHSRNALWHFYLPFYQPPPQLSSTLEENKLHSLYETLVPGSRGSRVDLI